MKSTPFGCHVFATDCTTWTTGPQVRDWQNCGVANVTTKGRPAAIAAATLVRSSSRSGGRAVLIERAVPPAPMVGFCDGIALSPTAGAAECLRTTISPSAWILRPPTGWARTQYFPGFGVWIRAT